ncbi:hypothetical protein CCYA_CCYA10G2846 [Cyanidiococcus yangmingshanensis]|nr:hypothetical protein CCYA_CCYA10G2846 [Cyanidiococcus yangmingshanensis]
MFFVRNWSLVRQVYIWGLDLASKVIYGRRAASWRRRQFELMTSGSVEGSASDETVTVAVDGVENGRLVQSGASAAERLGAVGQTRALAQRLERLNSELELGSLGEWESYDAIGGFWDVVGDETAQSDLTREETSLVSQRAGRQQAVLPLHAVIPPLSEALGAMVGDSLTRCFESSPPKVWNLMTRTSATGIPILLWPLWFLSIFVRYGILLPFRIFVLSAGVFSFALGFSFVQLSLRKRTRLKVYLQKQLIRFLASTLVASWSGLVHYHGERPRRRPNQIYVANHTSPIDLAIMIKDYPFSAIGQRHGGLAGRIQDLLNLVQNHVWFDREEGHDRRIVQRLLQAHVQDGEKEPVLVFPEGTCVNNEYCIMFKKGSFELGAQVYPVAIKYNKAYADVYWNSAKQTFLTHLLALMTSWAVVCDVCYLEPQSLRANETPAAFAARVKRLIARRIGLIETNWDGFLKRHQLSPKFREHRQEVLAYRIRKHLERVSVAALPSIPEESPLKPESKTGVDGEIHASETDAASSHGRSSWQPWQAMNSSQHRRRIPRKQNPSSDKQLVTKTSMSDPPFTRSVWRVWDGLVVRLAALGLLLVLVAAVSLVLLWLDRQLDLAMYLAMLWQQLCTLWMQAHRLMRETVIAEAVEAQRALRGLKQAWKLLWR